MQDTKERRGPTAFFVVFRSLLLLSVVMLAALSFSPFASAAESDEVPTRYVIPSGRTAGIKLFAEGVLVVGLSDITTDYGLVSPCKASGLKEGDVITHMNGTEVNSIEEVQAILAQCQGQEVTLSVMRDDKDQTLKITAAKSNVSDTYQLGAWIRDSMAGIGTLTFVDPQTGLFGTLGHGINDVDTSVLMRLQAGSIVPSSVAGVVKGMNGRPGELRGCFSSTTDLGTLFANTERGVFGHLIDKSAVTGDPVPVAKPDEVHTGEATILANVSGDEVQEYSVEILKLYPEATDTRDLMLRVTDPVLLEKTGGIVQGMSGSPILQDGRLVGAVTHVLIDHADRGYGIFAQHMLETAKETENAGS